MILYLNNFKKRKYFSKILQQYFRKGYINIHTYCFLFFVFFLLFIELFPPVFLTHSILTEVITKQLTLSFFSPSKSTNKCRLTLGVRSKDKSEEERNNKRKKLLTSLKKYENEFKGGKVIWEREDEKEEAWKRRSRELLLSHAIFAPPPPKFYIQKVSLFFLFT